MSWSAVLSGTLCLRVMLTLGHFLWQGAILAAVALLVLRLGRKRPAAWRYWVLTGTLLLMALSPVATFVGMGRTMSPAGSEGGTPAEASGSPVATEKVQSGDLGEAVARREDESHPVPQGGPDAAVAPARCRRWRGHSRRGRSRRGRRSDR